MLFELQAVYILIMFISQRQTCLVQSIQRFSFISECPEEVIIDISNNPTVFVYIYTRSIGLIVRCQQIVTEVNTYII